jgi:cytochrome o ubiquinol oxidase subunit 1
MTTIDTSAEHLAPAAAGSADRGSAVASVAAWMTSADHKRIGRLFVGAGLLALLATVVVGVLLAVERIDVTWYMLFDEDAAPQLFTAFRVGLAFGVVVPLLLGLAIAIVPLQLGARAMALPRLAVAGFWAWLAGLVMVIVSLATNGGPGGGEADMVDLYLVGLGFLTLGITAAAIALATTVLTTRAPGMWLHRVPVLAWSALVSSVGLVLTMPILLGDVVYLFLDHRNAKVAFGGNAGIDQWTGWALTQPQTFVYAIVALGVLADIVPVVARRRLPSRSGLLVAVSLLGFAALAGVSQTEHRLEWTSDGIEVADKVKSLVPFLIFNGLPALGVLGVLVLSAGIFRHHRPRLSAPFAWALLGVLLLLVATAANLVGLVDDAEVRFTVYGEGVFVCVGYAAVMGAVAGLAFWGPKLWGRHLANGPLVLLAPVFFLGALLVTAGHLIAGVLDQPASTLGGFEYSSTKDVLNIMVVGGHGLVLVAAAAVVVLAVLGFARGASAGDDPWDGHTLEWATSSPPPADNFAEIPTVVSAEPLSDLKRSGSDAR